MSTNKTNITKLMLKEFYHLSNSDLEIQINKNYNSLKNFENASQIANPEKDVEIGNMMDKFYLSLSNYFSKNTGSDFTNYNINYSSFNSFKQNYLKFLKYKVQPVVKVNT
jgi:hypothetical protein